MENGGVQELVHAQKALRHIEHELGVKEAEIHLMGDLKILFQLLIFGAELHVLAEIIQRHAAKNIFGEIHFTVTVFAHFLTVDGMGENALYLFAAERTGVAFAEQCHNGSLRFSSLILLSNVSVNRARRQKRKSDSFPAGLSQSPGCRTGR